MPKARAQAVDPDLAGLPSLDYGDDEPTAKEVADVLRELIVSDSPTSSRPKPNQSKPAVPAQITNHVSSAPIRTTHAAMPEARSEARADAGIVGIVAGRAAAYQREASLAFAQGDVEKGNSWLVKSVEMSQALATVLQKFPDPSAGESGASSSSASSGGGVHSTISSTSKDEISRMATPRVVQSAVEQARARRTTSACSDVSPIFSSNHRHRQLCAIALPTDGRAVRKEGRARES